MSESIADKNTLHRNDVVKGLMDATNMKRSDATEATQAIFGIIGGALAEGKKVQILDFGTFEPRERAARRGVRPGTTEAIDIPATTYPAFKPSTRLKSMIKEGQAHA